MWWEEKELLTVTDLSHSTTYLNLQSYWATEAWQWSPVAIWDMRRGWRSATNTSGCNVTAASSSWQQKFLCSDPDGSNDPANNWSSYRIRHYNLTPIKEKLHYSTKKYKKKAGAVKMLMWPLTSWLYTSFNANSLAHRKWKWWEM